MALSPLPRAIARFTARAAAPSRYICLSAFFPLAPSPAPAPATAVASNSLIAFSRGRSFSTREESAGRCDALNWACGVRVGLVGAEEKERGRAGVDGSVRKAREEGDGDNNEVEVEVER